MPNRVLNVGWLDRGAPVLEHFLTSAGASVAVKLCSETHLTRSRSAPAMIGASNLSWVTIGATTSLSANRFASLSDVSAMELAKRTFDFVKFLCPHSPPTSGVGGKG